jgi:hypothetical protein
VKPVALVVAVPSEMVTFLDPVAAKDEMANVAVTVEEFTTRTLLTVIPEPAFTPVVPPRYVPVRVTFTLYPWYHELGVIETKVGVT